MERLSALDAGFLQLEDEHVALHIGAAAVFDGPPPADAQMRERFAVVAATSPRYRQRLHRSLLDPRRPGWVDCEPELDYHVRRTALPAPGGPEELERLVGRVMSYRLDQARPLWEAWVVEGLEDDRWALIIKMHHSVVDGVGGMALFGALLDEPVDQPVPRRGAATGGRPGVLDLVRGLSRTLDGGVRYLANLRPTPATSLIGPLNGPRRFRTLTVELADVREIQGTFGGTVNDVVLAMVTRGFHGLLIERDEPPVAHAVRCLVPVSVRAPEQAQAAANHVSVMLVELPVELGDVDSTYEAVRARTGASKRSGQVSAGGSGLALANLLPAPVVAVTMGLVRRFPQRVLTTVVTNVPGPRHSGLLLGRRMIALFPYVPIAERIRLGVAVTSYSDRLHFGVTCDRVSVPDADRFVTAMATGLGELVKDAARHRR